MTATYQSPLIARPIELYRSRCGYNNQYSNRLADLASGPDGAGLAEAFAYLNSIHDGCGLPCPWTREQRLDWIEPVNPAGVEALRAEYAKLGTFREYLETREAA